MAEVSPFRATKKPPTQLEETLAGLCDEMATMRAEIVGLSQRQIEVAIPPAPNVNVTPKVSVTPEVEVEVNVAELLPVLKEIRDALKKPQVRTVERDDDGRITRITDRRT